MKNLYVDCNSRTVQVARLCTGLDVSTAGIIEEVEPLQFIRIKALNGDARIRLQHSFGDGVVISEGETEYFYIDRKVELLEGEVNIMY